MILDEAGFKMWAESQRDVGRDYALRGISAAVRRLGDSVRRARRAFAESMCGMAKVTQELRDTMVQGHGIPEDMLHGEAPGGAVMTAWLRLLYLALTVHERRGDVEAVERVRKQIERMERD